MVIARFIAGYGDVAIAVQKVGSQIESISWMSADGFGSALNAFVAQNYGANNIERVKKGTYSALKTCVLGESLQLVYCISFRNLFSKLFISEKDVIPLGVDYLQILALSQLFMCIESTLAGTLNGLGKNLYSIVYFCNINSCKDSIGNDFISNGISLNGIWWSISLSSILKGVVITICFIFVIKRLTKKPIE